MTWNEIMSAAASGASDPAPLLQQAGRNAVQRKAAAIFTSDAPELGVPTSTALPVLEPIAGLVRLMVRDHPATLNELMAIMQERNLEFPVGALPEALNIVSKRPAEILPLLGSRGEWLATQNPSWAQNVTKARQKSTPAIPEVSESDLRQQLEIVRNYEEDVLPELLNNSTNWSSDFSMWVLNQVRHQFHRAGPQAQFWKRHAPKVAATINPSTFAEADQILRESQAAASHPIIKAWFPILAIRRRLHRFLDSLDP